MFSVITNSYNKKIKCPNLIEFFTATGKLKKSFLLTTRDIRCVHHGWHGTHRYDIQFLATHVSTRVRRYSSMLQWSVPLGQRGLVSGSFAYFARNARCTVTTDLLVWYSNTQNDFSPGAAIFSLHILASPSGRNVHYDEKNLLGERKLSCSFYLYRFRTYVSYGFPIIHFCNPGVHYETPCIIKCRFIVFRFTIFDPLFNLSFFLKSFNPQLFTDLKNTVPPSHKSRHSQY